MSTQYFQSSPFKSPHFSRRNSPYQRRLNQIKREIKAIEGEQSVNYHPGIKFVFTFNCGPDQQQDVPDSFIKISTVEVESEQLLKVRRPKRKARRTKSSQTQDGWSQIRLPTPLSKRTVSTTARDTGEETLLPELARKQRSTPEPRLHSEKRVKPILKRRACSDEEPKSTTNCDLLYDIQRSQIEGCRLRTPKLFDVREQRFDEIMEQEEEHLESFDASTREKSSQSNSNEVKSVSTSLPGSKRYDSSDSTPLKVPPASNATPTKTLRFQETEDYLDSISAQELRRCLFPRSQSTTPKNRSIGAVAKTPKFLHEPLSLHKIEEKDHRAWKLVAEVQFGFDTIHLKDSQKARIRQGLNSSASTYRHNWVLQR